MGLLGLMNTCPPHMYRANILAMKPQHRLPGVGRDQQGSDGVPSRQRVEVTSTTTFGQARGRRGGYATAGTRGREGLSRRLSPSPRPPLRLPPPPPGASPLAPPCLPVSPRESPCLPVALLAPFHLARRPRRRQLAPIPVDMPSRPKVECACAAPCSRHGCTRGFRPSALRHLTARRAVDPCG